jgi:Pyruvate/2-oxoacid:ferredoxin oxidoreductase delta subunit
MVDSYVGPSGRLYGRAPFIALLEFQVRLKEESPLRAVCTRIMDAFIEGAVDVLPTRTPYYRVLPVEQTLRAPSQTRVVPVNVTLPDPREVLPIDVVSEMVRREELIVVADCYCRATKRLVGEDCGHPLETCFYFNELGMVKLEAGYGRRIDAAEALSILRACEEAGLVHNVSNCEGKIQTLCNCCACSCAVMKAVVRGQTNVGAPSRYRSSLLRERCTLCEACVGVCPVKAISASGDGLTLDAARCIGCGQCVSRCPQGALRMVLRDRPPKVYSDNDALFRRINMEAMLGLAARKLLGR